MESSDSSKSLESNNDVLTEILLRLPPKSIFKFTCVSKTWKNLIMDPCFFKFYDARKAGVRLFGFVQSYMYRNLNAEREYWTQRCLPAVGVKNEESELGGGSFYFFPDKQGYFIASSNHGLILWGCVPSNYETGEYYVGNPITKTWLALPPPPPVQTSNLSVSVGLTSKDEYSEGCGFRVIVASIVKSRDQKSMPIDTYSSKRREWRISILVSPKLITIMESEPPTVSHGIFHWFTKQDSICVTYDSTLLDDEDEGKKKDKKQHDLQLIQLPNLAHLKIIWRADDGKTIWYGSSHTNKYIEIYRKCMDDNWVLMNKVPETYTFDNNLKEISPKDIEINTNLPISEMHYRIKRNRICMVAFVPWDPRLIFVKFMGRVFIYNWEKKTMNELQLDITSSKTRKFLEGSWFLYFHSLSLSSYCFKNRPLPVFSSM